MSGTWPLYSTQAARALDQRATACLSADEVTQLNQLLARVMTSAPKAADR